MFKTTKRFIRIVIFVCFVIVFIDSVITKTKEKRKCAASDFNIDTSISDDLSLDEVDDVVADYVVYETN